MAGVWGIFEGGTVGSGSGLAPAAGFAAVGTVEYKLTVRILAVDTTTARGSLAVVTESEVLAEARSTTPAGHSQLAAGRGGRRPGPTGPGGRRTSTASR